MRGFHKFTCTHFANSRKLLQLLDMNSRFSCNPFPFSTVTQSKLMFCYSCMCTLQPPKHILIIQAVSIFPYFTRCDTTSKFLKEGKRGERESWNPKFSFSNEISHFNFTRKLSMLERVSCTIKQLHLNSKTSVSYSANEPRWWKASLLHEN